MKDRNGNNLRRGDVCVVHSPKHYGKLVVFRFPSSFKIEVGTCDDCEDSNDAKCAETTWVYRKNLEIIGDVR